ncbi:MAG: helix-turn-helix transcriptional regulator [Actinomyces sp.]|uniref:helix-turn-helix domain-containing protein n=1 Tax=Actinomyces sp. TaxID=29317 RepID=UPI0026DDB98A|nr:helix-turn-helix transcriptional regulator [Actinomyces sp.]MDO4243767.1 helix-turn-helix transcriptional regulator [Actinomyces sp.]
MDRGDAFAAYVGAELKGFISSRGWSAAAVAKATGHSASALNRWLNGKQSLPLAVLLEASDVLGIDPRDVVARAYARLAEEGVVGTGSVTALPTSRRVGPAMATVGDAPGWGEDVVADDSVPYAAHIVEMSAADEAEMMEESP